MTWTQTTLFFCSHLGFKALFNVHIFNTHTHANLDRYIMGYLGYSSPRTLQHTDARGEDWTTNLLNSQQPSLNPSLGKNCATSKECKMSISVTEQIVWLLKLTSLWLNVYDFTLVQFKKASLVYINIFSCLSQQPDWKWLPSCIF